MIEKVMHRGRIVYQTADEDCSMPEPALIVQVDNGGTLILQQENRYLTINRNAIPELIKALKQVAAEARQ